MAQPPRGKADYLALGDWNTVCFECGHKFKASQLRKHWQGYWVCPEHWEPRHPQDFVKGVPDNQTAPWVQPEPADVFVTDVCTLEGRSAMPGLAEPGCMIPGITYGPNGPIYSFCTLDSVRCIADIAVADCAQVGTP